MIEVGLNMYLYRTIDMSPVHGNGDIFVDKMEKLEKVFPELHLNVENGIEFREELATWKRANAIHYWMVNNVQKGIDDDGYHQIPIAKIKVLKVLAELALKSEQPQEILPTSENVLFGNANYDEEYRTNLIHTVDVLDNILKMHEEIVRDIDEIGMSYRIIYYYKCFKRAR